MLLYSSILLGLFGFKSPMTSSDAETDFKRVSIIFFTFFLLVHGPACKTEKRNRPWGSQTISRPSLVEWNNMVTSLKSPSSINSDTPTQHQPPSGETVSSLARVADETNCMWQALMSSLSKEDWVNPGSNSFHDWQKKRIWTWTIRIWTWTIRI